MSTRKQANQTAIEASIESHEISEQENEYLDYCQEDDIFDLDLDGWDFIPF